MVFDAFGVVCRGFCVDTDRQEELEHDLMPLSALAREAFAFARQSDGLIRLGGDVAFPLQSFDDAIGGNMTDCKPSRQIGKTACVAYLQNLVDRFDIVFSGFRGMIAPGPQVGFGVLRPFGHLEALTFGGGSEGLHRSATMGEMDPLPLTD